jgi:hypothetical protein
VFTGEYEKSIEKFPFFTPGRFQGSKDAGGECNSCVLAAAQSATISNSVDATTKMERIWTYVRKWDGYFAVKTIRQNLEILFPIWSGAC